MTLTYIVGSGQSNWAASNPNPPEAALSLVSEHPGKVLQPILPDGTLAWADVTGNLVTDTQWPGASLGYRAWEALPTDGSLGEALVMDCASGFTGLNISQLSSAQIRFRESMLRLADAHMKATRNGSGPVRVRAIHFIQGEGDDRDNTAQATYRTSLATLRTDYQASINGRTGQNLTVPLILDQTPAWAEYGQASPHIGLAQLAEAIANPDIYMVGGRYQLEGHRTGIDPDNIHYSNIGYYHLGELHARVFKAVVIDHVAWEPLRPSGATLNGAVITVQFLVPVAPLKFDTTIVASQTNKGFTVQSDSGAETITNVALGVDGTSVVITLSGAPGANPKVRYGFQSQYGNLCDSETATSARDGAALANWCVHFEQTVS